eukprot:1160614-Pelagomonas_calceolata.AAC.9
MPGLECSQGMNQAAIEKLWRPIQQREGHQGPNDRRIGRYWECLLHPSTCLSLAHRTKQGREGRRHPPSQVRADALCPNRRQKLSGILLFLLTCSTAKKVAKKWQGLINQWFPKQGNGLHPPAKMRCLRGMSSITASITMSARCRAGV